MKRRSLIKSFLNAFTGLMDVIKKERNFRLHTVAFYYISIFSLAYDLDRSEYAVMFLTIFVVLALEIINTVVESLVDIKVFEKNEHARLAKDAAASAVLVSAICSILVAVSLFGRRSKFFSALLTIIGSPYYIIALAAPIIPSILFIIGRKSWGKKLPSFEEDNKNERNKNL